MENLVLHIEYLLLRNDCVIIPGVGALINARHPACFDAASNAWMPMTCETRFNAAVCSDDGLLANSYARKMRISYTEARNILENDIRSLRAQLASEGEVLLGRIGILRSNDNIISFAPLRSAEALNAELGLHSVDIDAHSILAVNPTETAANSSHATHHTEETPVSESENAYSATECDGTPSLNKTEGRKLDFNKNYYIPINKRIARAVASCLLIALLAIPMLLPSSENEADKKVHKASVAPLAQVEAIIDSTIKKDAADTSQNRGAQNIKPAAIDSESANGNISRELRYFLIVATFANERDAQNYIQHEGKSEYELIMLPTSTLCRVAAKGSSNREDLLQTLNSSDFKQKFQGGWIWESK